MDTMNLFEGKVDILYVLAVKDKALFFTEKGKRYVSSKWSGHEAEVIATAVQRLNFNGKIAYFIYEGDKIASNEVDSPPGLKDKHILPFLKRIIKKEGGNEELIGYRFYPQKSKIFYDVFDQDYYKKLRMAFFEVGLALELIISLNGALEVVARNLANKNKEELPFILQISDDESDSFLLYYDTEKMAPAVFRNTHVAHDEEETLRYFKRNIQIGRHMFGGVEPKIILIELDNNKELPLFKTDEISLDILRFNAFLDLLKELNGKDRANIVPKKDRELNKQKNFIIFGWSAIICLVMLIATGIWLLGEDINELKTDLEKAKAAVAKKEQLANKTLKYELYKNLHDELAAAEEPAVLNTLIIAGNMAPDTAVFRKWEARYIGKTVVFALEGEISPPFDEAAIVLEAYQKRLTQPPLKAEITKSWEDGWLRAIEESHYGGALRDAKFSIEGVIK